MLSYKITNTDKINTYANRKSISVLKIITGIWLFILCISIFKNEEDDNLITLIVIFSFIGGLFYLMYLAVKKLMGFLGKNLTYIIDDNSLVVKQSIDDETEMGFLSRYFYRKGKNKGGYRDITVKFDKIKSIRKNNKGDLIVKTNPFTTGKITIPRELENLRDLEHQLQAKNGPSYR